MTFLLSDDDAEIASRVGEIIRRIVLKALREKREPQARVVILLPEETEASLWNTEIHRYEAILVNHPENGDPLIFHAQYSEPPAEMDLPGYLEALRHRTVMELLHLLGQKVYDIK